jgi:hypothetical protein
MVSSSGATGAMPSGLSGWDKFLRDMGQPEVHEDDDPGTTTASTTITTTTLFYQQRHGDDLDDQHEFVDDHRHESQHLVSSIDARGDGEHQQGQLRTW